MYIIRFSKQTDKDKKLLKGTGLDTKAKQLLNIIAKNPFQTPPPYEGLVGQCTQASSLGAYFTAEEAICGDGFF